MAATPYHRENLAAAIQQRARQELDTNGATDLSLRQLAKFLGVSPAAIYRHFPDKAHLLAVLRADIVAEVTTTLHQGVLDSPDAETMLTRMVANLLTYAQEHPQAIAFILTGPLAAPQSLQTVLALLVTQNGLTGAPAALTAPVWTFLLGVLCQPTQELSVSWVVTQLEFLLGIPTSYGDKNL